MALSGCRRPEKLRQKVQTSLEQLWLSPPAHWIADKSAALTRLELVWSAGLGLAAGSW